MKHAHDTDKVTFGFWLYLMSDAVLFAALFAAYAVLRTETFGGVTPRDILDLPFVLVETLLLLTSSFTAGLALLAAHTGKKSLTLAWLGITLALGLGFLAMELYEFAHLIGEGMGPARSASLSAFFTLLGTHGLHVAAGCLWMLVVMLHIARRGLIPGTYTKLACLSLFWHFLDIVWIFIFTFVYLFAAV